MPRKVIPKAKCPVCGVEVNRKEDVTCSRQCAWTWRKRWTAIDKFMEAKIKANFRETFGK